MSDEARRRSDAARAQHLADLHRRAFDPVGERPFEDERRRMPVGGAPRAARHGPVQSLLKRQICALRGYMDAPGDPVERLPMCLSMLCVLHPALKQHQALATLKLQPRSATLPNEWIQTMLGHLEALAPACRVAVDFDSDEMLFTPEALYTGLSMVLFRQYTLHGGNVHYLYLEWIMCDMEVCAEDHSDAGGPNILTMFRIASPVITPGPRVSWCLAHGAVGAAALLRAYLRAFEYTLDWHERVLAPTLTPADETQMHAARESALYDSIDTRIWEAEDNDMGAPSRAENINNCLFLERTEYTAMRNDPRDPYGTVLGNIPPPAGGGSVRAGIAGLHVAGLQDPESSVLGLALAPPGGPPLQNPYTMATSQ